MRLGVLFAAGSLVELSLAGFLTPGLQSGLQRRDDEEEELPKFRAEDLPGFLAKEYKDGVDPEAPTARPEQCKNGGCLRSLPVEYHGLANPNLKPELRSGPIDEEGPIAEDVGDGNYLATVPIVGSLMRMLGLDKGIY
ncbi:hypothetical protein DSO57_1015118 [Entomophthora muscae]|uniref:Uncharacterized protein n=1 Tax=Entomophthora muscae TaxID=34485 RepID=A0ACC2SUV3_9FUNG|nr:hypothetical protein DSO57_1015118 [Entomophthora muscae]